MSEPFYVCRSTVEKVHGVHRRGHMEIGDSENGVPVDFGVHGAIKAHYKLDSPDQPLPVDYMVAATGG